jgi:hypothetical protein
LKANSILSLLLAPDTPQPVLVMIVRIASRRGVPCCSPLVSRFMARQGKAIVSRWSPAAKAFFSSSGYDGRSASRFTECSSSVYTVPQPALALAYDYVNLDDDNDEHDDVTASSIKSVISGTAGGGGQRSSGSSSPYPPPTSGSAAGGTTISRKSSSGGGGGGSGRHRCPKVRVSHAEFSFDALMLSAYLRVTELLFEYYPRLIFLFLDTPMIL